jgi:hypothetical protein
MSLKAWSSRGAAARHHDLCSSASSGFVTGTGGRAQAKRERRIPIMKIRFIYRNIALSLSSIHPHFSNAEAIDIAGWNLPPKSAHYMRGSCSPEPRVEMLRNMQTTNFTKSVLR